MKWQSCAAGVSVAVLCTTAHAFGGTLVLKKAQGQAGATVAVAVLYRQGGGTAAAGLATDIEFDRTVLSQPRCAPGPALAAVSKSVICSETTPGRLRLGILGLDTTSVPQGEVARVTFAVAPTARPGRYKLRQHPTAADSDGRDYALRSRDGVVRIGGK
jgi:hypothetical protein